MEVRYCPMCKSSAVLPGHLGTASEGGIATTFVPIGMQSIFARPGVWLCQGSLSCLSCGHVWTRLAPDELRLYIRTHGDELVKQCLDFLEHGPDRDLPDVPEARLAGLGVAEIDALMLAGQLPAATRRLRELTGRTWDEAVNSLRNWRALKRARKLELLGWVSKRPFEEAVFKAAEHPMRDPWLDG
jgi:hypothetical protein